MYHSFVSGLMHGAIPYIMFNRVINPCDLVEVHAGVLCI